MRNVWFPAVSLIVSGVWAPAAWAQPPADAQPVQSGPASNVTSYQPPFFSQFRPNTAMDMINRIPGFSFDGGSSARGFSGTAGNVLVDGERPPSRNDTLTSVLSRIPASSVARIDVIRGGADGVDMQGQAIVANVIRKEGSGFSGAVNGGANVTSRGKASANSQIEVQDDRNGRLLAGSVAASWSAGDGLSFRRRTAPSGALLLDATSQSETQAESLSLNGVYEGILLGGKLRLNGQAVQRENSSTSDEQQIIPHGAQLAGNDSQTTSGEIGLRYARDIAGVGVEVVAFQSLQKTDSSNTLNAPAFTSGGRSREDRGESILRASVRPPSLSALSVETGAEAVYNFTESEAARVFNGQVFSLTGDAFQADELRAEVFATLSWKPFPTINADIGGRYEWSRIAADVSALESEKELSYFKPRLNLSWSPAGGHKINLRLERIVDQLSFSGFASSASFENSVFGIGNPEIEPEKSWLIEAQYERQFGGQNSLVAKLTHREIEDVLGRIIIRAPGAPGQPVQLFETTRNIGEATRDALNIRGSFELDRLGMAGGIFSFGLDFRHSETVDPVTFDSRRLSNDTPFFWNFSLQQTLADGAFRWAIFVQDGEDAYSWAPRSVLKDANLMFIGGNISWKPAPGWSLGAGINDILKRGGRSWSVFYSDGRDIGAPLYVERGGSRGNMLAFVSLRKDL